LGVALGGENWELRMWIWSLDVWHQMNQAFSSGLHELYWIVGIGWLCHRNRKPPHSLVLLIHPFALNSSQWINPFKAERKNPRQFKKSLGKQLSDRDH
jgi:hypothetical protein